MWTWEKMGTKSKVFVQWYQSHATFFTVSKLQDKNELWVLRYEIQAITGWYYVWLEGEGQWSNMKFQKIPKICERNKLWKNQVPGSSEQVLRHVPKDNSHLPQCSKESQYLHWSSKPIPKSFKILMLYNLMVAKDALDIGRLGWERSCMVPTRKIVVVVCCLLFVVQVVVKLLFNCLSRFSSPLFCLSWNVNTSSFTWCCVSCNCWTASSSTVHLARQWVR